MGICLGAQLIAHAAGARVYPNSRVLVPGEPPQVVREVGWGEVRFINPEREPVLSGLGASAMMLHWHGDTYDLPVGAVLLASTPQCPHQAFRIGSHAVALQFHAEVQAEQVRVWCDEDAAFVLKANGADGRSRLLSDNERFAVASQAARDRLLTNILDLLATSRPTA
jgi:GMP synthase (glutamine-hydrolysing)